MQMRVGWQGEGEGGFVARIIRESALTQYYSNRDVAMYRIHRELTYLSTPAGDEVLLNTVNYLQALLIFPILCSEGIWWRVKFNDIPSHSRYCF